MREHSPEFGSIREDEWMAGDSKHQDRRRLPREDEAGVLRQQSGAGGRGKANRTAISRIVDRFEPPRGKAALRQPLNAV